MAVSKGTKRGHRGGWRQRKDRGGRRFRQVTRQGNDLCMYGAQKATCISHRDEVKLHQQPEIAAGKKVLKYSTFTCSVFMYSFSFILSSPLHFPLHLLPSLYPSFYLSHTLAYTPSLPTQKFLLFFYLPLSISPLLSVFLCTPFLPPRNTFPGENWITVEGAAG